MYIHCNKGYVFSYTDDRNGIRYARAHKIKDYRDLEHDQIIIVSMHRS